ncbi:Cytochrome P450 18a1, partial [Stegodyphus mimosarum]
MEVSSLLLIIVFVILILYTVFLRKSHKTPPGPWGLPVIGYIPFISSKVHLDFEKLAKIYGPIFSLKLGSQYAVVFNDFSSTKEAFAQDAFMGRPPESPFEQHAVTRETDAINGLPWKEQRRFSMQMLRDLGFGKPRMEELIREEIIDLSEHIEKSQGKPIEMRPLLSPSMSNNIAILVFGKRLPFDDPRRKMLDYVVNETAKQAGQVIWQLFFPGLAKVLNFFHLGGTSSLSKLNLMLKDYIDKEVAEHEKTLNESDIRDFIDGYLIEIRKRNDPTFCRPVLIDVVGAFFGGGSETVRTTLDWLLLTMAGYSDVQKKVQFEIDEVISRERMPTYSDHLQMPYTEATIMELWRWRTIIPINVVR